MLRLMLSMGIMASAAGGLLSFATEARAQAPKKGGRVRAALLVAVPEPGGPEWPDAAQSFAAVPLTPLALAWKRGALNRLIAPISASGTPAQVPISKNASPPSAKDGRNR